MRKEKSLVLIVDDVKTNIEFITDVIASSEHIESIGITNSVETLKIAIDKKPDLILLDISMPRMDGYQVCRQLKENPLTAEIPIIFLTARVLKDDIIKGFEAGAIDYIAKPFNLIEMMSRVKTQLDLRNKKKELLEINQKLEQKVEERTQQLVELNRTLSEANEKLNKANKSLSSLDYAKNEFIAHINHELRTPLNGIVGYTSLLEEADLDDESRYYLNSINTLISRLIKVSETSLIFTELQTIDHNIKLTETKLSDIIGTCYNQAEVCEKELYIEVDNISELPSVLGEIRLIKACFSIIMDNAVKYSPRNGKIQIHGINHSDKVIVTIQDEGPGISDLARASLFELFTADNLQYKAHGFGIGLATAKHIMELMEGKISIENNSIKGTSVWLEFEIFKQ
jgi:signal transduction histidine kinase